MASDINSVVLVGRLVADCTRRYTQNNERCYMDFTIATNRSKKVNDEWKNDVYYIDCNVSNKSDKISEYLTKGRGVIVKGYIRQERWEADGAKRSKIVVVAENIQFIGSEKESKAEKPDPKDTLYDEGVDNDIPF